MRRPKRGQHKVVPWSRDRVLAVRDELLARYQLMAEALVSLIRADIAAGDLRQDLDADASVSLLLGAYLGELVRRGRIDDGFAERCVELMWVAMTGGSPTGS